MLSSSVVQSVRLTATFSRLSAALSPGVLLVVIWLLLPAHLGAQDDPEGEPPPGYEIASIAFDGNSTLSDGTLAGFIQSRESPSGFSQFMHGTFWGAFGSPAEIFDPVTLDQDADILSDLYRTRGFTTPQSGRTIPSTRRRNRFQSGSTLSRGPDR